MFNFIPCHVTDEEELNMQWYDKTQYEGNKKWRRYWRTVEWKIQITVDIENDSDIWVPYIFVWI